MRCGETRQHARVGARMAALERHVSSCQVSANIDKKRKSRKCLSAAKKFLVENYQLDDDDDRECLRGDSYVEDDEEEETRDRQLITYFDKVLKKSYKKTKITIAIITLLFYTSSDTQDC